LRRVVRVIRFAPVAWPGGIEWRPPNARLASVEVLAVGEGEAIDRMVCD